MSGWIRRGGRGRGMTGRDRDRFGWGFGVNGADGAGHKPSRGYEATGANESSGEGTTVVGGVLEISETGVRGRRGLPRVVEVEGGAVSPTLEERRRRRRGTCIQVSGDGTGRDGGHQRASGLYRDAGVESDGTTGSAGPRYRPPDTSKRVGTGALSAPIIFVSEEECEEGGSQEASVDGQKTPAFRR